MDSTVLLTDGKDSPDMISTDAAVRAELASVASPGTISLGGNYSVLTCAGLKASMLGVIEGEFTWKDQSKYIADPNYKALSYIESDGNVCIDIPISNLSANTHVDMLYTPMNITQDYQGIYCYRVTAGQTTKTIFQTYGTGYRVDNSVSNTFSYGLNVGNIYHIKLVDNSFIVNEKAISVNQTNVSTKNLRLFAAQNNGTLVYGAKMRLYNFRLTDNTNGINMFLVPAERISDHALGLYDSNNKQFYTGQGSGHFSGQILQDNPIDKDCAPIINSYSYIDHSVICDAIDSGAEFNINVKQGVYLPEIGDYISKLNEMHYMYTYLKIGDITNFRYDYCRESFNIGPVGAKTNNAINYMMDAIDLYVLDYKHLAIDVDSSLFEHNFGNNKSKEHIIKVVSSLTTLETVDSAIHSTTFAGVELHAGTLDMEIEYNFMDSYKLSFDFTVQKQDGTTYTISKSKLLLSSEIASIPTIPAEGYTIRYNNILFKGDSIFAYNVVNVKNQIVLLADGTTLDLNNPNNISAFDIPEEYVQVAYVESDGKEYIDIPIADLSNHTYIDFIYTPMIITQDYQGIYCYRIAAGQTTKTIFQTYGTGYRVDNSSNQNFTYSLNPGLQYRITLQDNTFMVNEKSVAVNQVNVATNNLRLFGAQNNGTLVYGAKMRLTNFVLNDTANNIYLSLIPVRRVSDGIYGLYDTISKAFYCCTNGNNLSGPT